MGKWEMVCLQDTALLMTDGDWIESKDQSPNGIRLLQVGNIGKGFFVNKPERAKYISESTFVKLKCTEVLAGDILISRLPDPIGRACIIPELDTKTITAVDCTIIRVNPEKCNKRYLLHFFCSPQYYWQIEKYVVGSTRSRISRKNLQTISTSLPPISVQKQIAEVLDRTSTLIEKRKAQIEKLDLLVKSQFIKMFCSAYNDCKMCLLPDVCHFIDYRGKTPEKSNKGIPLITAKNVKDNHFSIEPREYIPIENYNDVMTRGFPKENDVLFTTEAPLGNVCRIPPIFEKFCVGQRIITMQPYSGIITSEYLENALLAQQFQDEMWRKSSGSTVKGIRSKELALLSIPVPEYQKQKDFSGIVQQIEAQKKLLQQSLAKLELNYKSLMQKCFRGEIF